MARILLLLPKALSGRDGPKVTHRIWNTTSLARMVVCPGIHRIVVGDGKFLVQKTNEEDNTLQASRDNTESAQVYGMKNRHTSQLMLEVLGQESLKELPCRASHKNFVAFELIVFSQILAWPGLFAASHKLLVHSW
jgi:hypothetical protein